MLIEFDLAGAEWVVIAYLSGDKNMLEIAQSGRSPHTATGSLISGAPESFVEEESKLVGLNSDPDLIRELRTPLKEAWGSVLHSFFLPRSMSVRQAGKKSNHGLNYGMRYRRFALENEMMETDAKPIVEAYSTTAYPGLQNYWEDTRRLLRRDRTLTNCFGRKVRLLGEWGPELFNQAYSFRPQSTVFDVCRIGMMSAFRDESAAFRPAQLAAQVHDSLLFDYLSHHLSGIREFCCKMKHHYMRPLLRIADPEGISREFQLGVDVKMGWNWGEMKDVPYPEDLTSLEPYLPPRLRQEDLRGPEGVVRTDVRSP